jgi:nitrate/nitrite transport system substrate-binding protein
MLVDPPPEKPALQIRFIPIACSAPLLYAKSGGFFERNGLSVELETAPGWSGVKELLVYGKVDAAHMLSPMPLASSLGIDGKPSDLRLCAVQNVNGQALIVARKHAGIGDVRGMKGFTFGVPYTFSMHYYLLCDLLAKHGVDPLSDVTIEEVVPPRMPYYLAKGRLDAVLSPEPFGELIVSRGEGFIHTLSKDIWPGHPCCAFATTQRFIDAYPATHLAMVRSVIEAERALHEADAGERARIARDIAGIAKWSEAAVLAMQRVLAGSYQDRAGQERAAADRIDFIPHPFRAYGVWILSQMQRWNQLRREVDYDAVTRAVFLEDTARDLAAAAGYAEGRPSLDGVLPRSADDALAVTRSQPFCAFQPQSTGEARSEIAAGTRDRLTTILEWLASVTGGERAAPLAITGPDEVGWLEWMLDEMVRNTRFAREALDEQLEMEEQARRQQATIAAQEEAIRELSTPIVPVLDRVIVLPIVGRVDRARVLRITEALLGEVTRASAEIVLIDVTAVQTMDADVVEQMLCMVRAASLLGAECVIVGVTTQLAHQLATREAGRPLPAALSDLRSGIEYALRRTGRRIAPADGPDTGPRPGPAR